MAHSPDKKISRSLDNITTLHQRLSEAENKIEQLKTSLSWRITEPLRFVRDRLVSAVWRVRKAISKGPVKAPAILTESSRSIIAPLFDEEYYTSLNPEANASDRSPVDHYIERGWKEGLKPHPLFDPAWYLKENPEVAKAGVEPLHHYMTSGWRDGRSPHPLFDVRYYLNQAPELYEMGMRAGHSLPPTWRTEGAKAESAFRSGLVRKL